METSLIKDEGGLDIHPKKTVICLKKQYRNTLLNYIPKNFKTKDGKKNQTIRKKAINKLTNKTPLEPEVSSSTIKNFLPEDLDTKSSDDHNELGYSGDDEEWLPESETVLITKSEDFKTEDGKSWTIRQNTLKKLTNKRPLVEPKAPSMKKAILPEEDLDTESWSDYMKYEQLPKSDSEDSEPSEVFILEERASPESIMTFSGYSSSSFHSVIKALFKPDGGEPEMISDDEINSQVKSTH